MDKTEQPRVSTNLSVRLPADVAALLHRAAYETGRSKQALVSEAIWQVYGDSQRR